MSLKDEAATRELGARIARALAPGDIIALSGDLGAGKTVLARAILRALGVDGHVPSPTFTLVQAYETPNLTVHHIDLYRIEDRSELTELGLDEALDAGAALVEWPERGLPERLSAGALHVALQSISEEARQARITGPERWRAIFQDRLP